MTLPVCPNCEATGGMYYAGSWCAYCGWHASRQTIAHANFGRDENCEWCTR